MAPSILAEAHGIDVRDVIVLCGTRLKHPTEYQQVITEDFRRWRKGREGQWGELPIVAAGWINEGHISEQLKVRSADTEAADEEKLVFIFDGGKGTAKRIGKWMNPKSACPVLLPSC